MTASDMVIAIALIPAFLLVFVLLMMIRKRRKRTGAALSKWAKLALLIAMIIAVGFAFNGYLQKRASDEQIEQVEYIEKGKEAGRHGDFTEAMRWLIKASDLGSAAAQCDIGVMYENGQGVPVNYAEAAKWYGKSAEHGNAAAQYNLGMMYFKGQGIPQDYVQAYVWFDIAASGTDTSENNTSEVARIQRDFLAKQMSEAQLAEAQRKATEWKPK